MDWNVWNSDVGTSREGPVNWNASQGELTPLCLCDVTVMNNEIQNSFTYRPSCKYIVIVPFYMWKLKVSYLIMFSTFPHCKHNVWYVAIVKALNQMVSIHTLHSVI